MAIETFIKLNVIPGERCWQQSSSFIFDKEYISAAIQKSYTPFEFSNLRVLKKNEQGDAIRGGHLINIYIYKTVNHFGKEEYRVIKLMNYGALNGLPIERSVQGFNDFYQNAYSGEYDGLATARSLNIGAVYLLDMPFVGGKVMDPIKSTEQFINSELHMSFKENKRFITDLHSHGNIVEYHTGKATHFLIRDFDYYIRSKNVVEKFPLNGTRNSWSSQLLKMDNGCYPWDDQESVSSGQYKSGGNGYKALEEIYNSNYPNEAKQIENVFEGFKEFFLNNIERQNISPQLYTDLLHSKTLPELVYYCCLADKPSFFGSHHICADKLVSLLTEPKKHITPDKYKKHNELIKNISDLLNNHRFDMRSTHQRYAQLRLYALSAGTAMNLREQGKAWRDDTKNKFKQLRDRGNNSYSYDAVALSKEYSDAKSARIWRPNDHKYFEDVWLGKKNHKGY
ncbi:hypothetical protein E4K63_03230 [Allofrancisella inopinata]|uniref:Uncharacterized protein n=1 Tax=Allofrancisella inopinata TaxID=1085647 RepID=A0AAE6YJH5_9GAMM|nr:hypothetical protein [Allofrancisella inopinata]QIV95892.1 hypothetical protein E4K63_03230 [Allofrancisella inopinata]